jgi:hypothetical protein
VLLAGGLVGMLIGGGVFVQSWYESWLFEQSGQADRLERQASVLENPPLWLEAGAESTPSPAPPTATPVVAATAAAGPAAVEPLASPTASPTPERLADPALVEVASVDFRFDDPPEPGARARLSVELHSQANVRSDRIDLASAAKWFAGYEVIGAVPPVLDDRTTPDGIRHFIWPGLAPGQTARLELHLAAVEDDVDPPDVTVSLGDGARLAQVKPRTVSPRPRPGPARALSIPKLQLQTGVVQTAWEPPPFVVGQIAGTANLSEGNTIVIGHLRGTTGNVFERLDRLAPGDEVIAVSRGLEYRFVVSGRAILPKDDHSPMVKTETPRLTLMTCIGRWDPILRDYDERLWVIAEPPELAEQTIANQAALTRQAAAEHAQVAAQATARAQATAESRATATAEELARPTATPSPPAGPTARPQPARAGVAFRDPAIQSKDGRQATVRGRVATPFQPDLRLWLFTRQLEDGPWMPVQEAIAPRADGTWEAEIGLEGKAGTRYELRVGPVDAESLRLLQRYVQENPGRPLVDLPDGFLAEAAVVVTRNR